MTRQGRRSLLPYEARHRSPTHPGPVIWTQRRYAVAPTATSAVALLLLAGVRVAGAFYDVLLVASVALTPCVLLLIPRASWRRIGLRGPVSRARAAVGVVAVVAAYVVVVVGCTQLFGLSQDNWLHDIPTLFTSVAPHNPLVIGTVAAVSMGVLVPLAEEVCFRGVLHEALTLRWTSMSAVVVTAGVWALVHLGDYGLQPFNGAVIAGMLPSVFLMGVALGWCRVITGSVLVCVVAQGSANLLLTAWVFGVLSA